MTLREKMKYFNPDNYCLEKNNGNWVMRWKVRCTEESARGFGFCIPHRILYLWMQAVTDYRVIRVINDHACLLFVDKEGGILHSPLVPEYWSTLDDNGDILVGDYHSFVILVTDLYARYAEKSSMTTERMMYDPSKYILQCDFEDDCFMVFAESDAEKEWGDREFSIGLSEESFKKLLALLSKGTVYGIDFQVSNSKYGSGDLAIHYSSSNGTCITHLSCEQFSDISCSTKLRNLERIHLIYTLLQTLYDKEFPNTKEKNKKETPLLPYENVPKSDVNTTRLNRLIRLQEELDWFLADVICPKYHNNKERFCEECEIMREVDNEIRIERENCNKK